MGMGLMPSSIIRRVLAAICLAAAVLAIPASAQVADPPILARINLVVRVDRLDLPVYAALQDAWGQDYALVIAPRVQLDRAGWPYQVLDADSRGREYVIGRKRGVAARAGACRPTCWCSTMMAGRSSLAPRRRRPRAWPSWASTSDACRTRR